MNPILSKDAFCHSQTDLNNYSQDDDSLRLSRKRSLPSLFGEDDFNLSFYEALKIEKRKPLTEMFVQLSELKSFIELNKIGFGKALKKFDKTLLTQIRDSYMNNLNEKSHIFNDASIDSINEKLESIIQIYSIFTQGDFKAAKQALRSNLREYIVWERNTVWRNMIGMERKTQAVRASKRTKIGENSSLSSQDNEKFDIYIGAGRKVTIPAWIVSGNTLKVVLIALITATLLVFSPFSDAQQKNCFAILVCASLFWATEAIPLFANHSQHQTHPNSSVPQCGLLSSYYY
ncbi:unnamed protein product [Ambrosiozyma monospora]|uniref:Unnamed protein product n=1 Tax=Ambrosiozyma monospora TaxID=43982 RepID=A0ACB5TA38_AMBMO|nr:unnamed protein product [Ambrosiozyma monospora]